MKQGKVYLVGAGPGDPGLITVKGMERLSQAEVIVYDHLLDERVLDAASPNAEKIYAGKSGSEHTLEQSEINKLLLAKAREGKMVVRLKGGDPFVFGRGGEEAEALFSNGIPFEIVPGVTSAVAAPVYAGIPVTHRGVASSFAVVTGHEDPTKPNSAIDWAKLATGVDTLVFLMGMQNLPQIVAKLVENGRPETTPVAVVKNGTHPEQETVIGTLASIVSEVKKRRLTAPAVIVVGEVVALRDRIRWFDNRPLSGKRVLVTRSRQQASVLSRMLSERGARPVELPVIDIKPVEDNEELDQAILGLEQYQWLVLTSVNGVDAFFNRLHALKLDARALNGVKIASIGPATAKALEANGVVADFCPKAFTSQGIIGGLRALNIAGQKFLLPRADIADKDLVKGIEGLGGIVHEIAVYRTSRPVGVSSRAKEVVASGKIDLVTFTSSSTVTNLVVALGGASLNGARVACIGPKTAETAVKAGLKVDIIASESTIPGLVAAMEEFFVREA